MSDDKSDDLPTGPGSELRETREGMEVSVREVADALNLPARVIEALESDDYEGLPPTVFTRGYLRSYARLLELSPDALLSRYPEVTEEVDVITGESAVTPAASADSNPQLLYGGFALAALVVIVLAWVFLGGEDSPAPEPIVEAGSESEASRGPPAATATNTVEDAPSSELAQADDREPGAGPVLSEPLPGARVQNEREATPEPEPEPAATSRVGADLPAPVPETTVEEQPAPLPEPQRDVSPAESAATPGATIAADPVADPAEQDPAVPAAPSDAGSEISDDAAPEPTLAAPVPTLRERRITEFGDDELRFVFSEDCWVEVRNAEGENLYSDLNRAGATLVLTGRAPFRILLGYAPGVSLDFNGESVPLDRYSRNNVANVVLGE